MLSKNFNEADDPKKKLSLARSLSNFISDSQKLM